MAANSRSGGHGSCTLHSGAHMADIIGSGVGALVDWAPLGSGRIPITSADCALSRKICASVIRRPRRSLAGRPLSLIGAKKNPATNAQTAAPLPPPPKADRQWDSPRTQRRRSETGVWVAHRHKGAPGSHRGAGGLMPTARRRFDSAGYAGTPPA